MDINEIGDIVDWVDVDGVGSMGRGAAMSDG